MTDLTSLMNRALSASAISAACLLATDAASAGQTEAVCLHESPALHLNVNVPSLYPEGIEIDPKTGDFLLGSIRQGAVYRVPASGEALPLVEDDRLTSVVGIRVDEARQRLWVNNSDYGAAERSQEGGAYTIASVGVYDLASGDPLHFVDLSALRPSEDKFPNDLAVDQDGNAYVTDSLAAAIYKVTADGEGSVFLTDDAFRGDGFNLNGIVVHPDGYLIVAQKSIGKLYKVPLDAPETFAAIDLPRPLVATDGLVLTGPKHLIAMTNRSGETESDTIFSLTSDDAWASAEISGSLETGDVYAMTAVVNDGRVFANYGRLNTLGATLEDSAANPFIESFEIREIAKMC
ncbi:MAG: L-dopachrome tautomerase-related protein [Geminicoccaceae bacterium]